MKMKQLKHVEQQEKRKQQLTKKIKINEKITVQIYRFK